MSPPSGTASGPVVTPSRVVAGLCLFAPFVSMLWVGSYDSIDPKFIGIPFFYWYQMLWVPISTLLTCIAYVLVRREQAARKQATRPPEGSEPK
ncbi:DUF3311 domain-containing protein [Streptomyces sp. N2-109]|uniref:DUF3311 domain-containing protein n=1 Tax=Streptomyces gossypii TaxID=2883101 RepID=A0ABT2JVF6_9ACTN|nr:DUF3311 domain-containing protein [Streptomyces gossypii]MCT2591845.1 DUF3311 domain-containing protein [Streptomyces gossypii]